MAHIEYLKEEKSFILELLNEKIKGNNCTVAQCMRWMLNNECELEARDSWSLEAFIEKAVEECHTPASFDGNVETLHDKAERIRKEKIQDYMSGKNTFGKIYN